MKVTVNEQTVRMVNLDGEPVWMDEQNKIIGKVVDMKAKYDCTEERIKIGQAMRAAREAAGISQERLEALTGITKANIINYEYGRVSVGIDAFVRIGNVIGYQFFRALE